MPRLHRRMRLSPFWLFIVVLADLAIVAQLSVLAAITVLCIVAVSQRAPWWHPVALAALLVAVGPMYLQLAGPSSFNSDAVVAIALIGLGVVLLIRDERRRLTSAAR